MALYVQNVETETTALRPRPGGSSLGTWPGRWTSLSGLATTLLGPVLAQHLRDAIDAPAHYPRGVSDRIVGRMAVGFVDLVGSTQAANQMTSRALLEKVSLFEITRLRPGERARWPDREARRRRGHVRGVERRCRMSARPGDDRASSRPAGIQPRAGLAFGEVITFHGDYYGPVVNLASRLTDQSVPGEVLVDSALQCRIGRNDICFEPAGRRQLKGFDEPSRRRRC